MTELRLYDTASREKRVFTPREADRITMYLCGPTVYGRAHIGNARPAVVFDVLASLLRHLYPDHRLDYARNITDVDDKIIAAAAAENVDPSVITDRFERHYLEDTAALGVAAPHIQPHATQHVPDMIAMIARLVELGHAYAAEGHVLFSVASDPDYGSLSRRDADALRAGARVEVAPYKRAPGDFILWKPSEPDVIGWPSPWGRGRPGWHIECSAMIERHLGTTIDIHAGGLDLIFPHHENEAAQSRCAHGGEPLANIWMHNGFLAMGGGEKMSKSLGNVVLIKDLLQSGRRGLQLRFALLSGHYRSPLDWDDNLIGRSQRTLDNLRNDFNRWRRDLRKLPRYVGPPDHMFIKALQDDLNTPEALSRISELAGKGEWQTCIASLRVIGLADYLLKRRESPGTYNGKTIQQWIDLRNAAKERKDFREADEIRALLDRYNVVLDDTPTKTFHRRIRDVERSKL